MEWRILLARLAAHRVGDPRLQEPQVAGIERRRRCDDLETLDGRGREEVLVRLAHGDEVDVGRHAVRNALQAKDGVSTPGKPQSDRVVAVVNGQAVNEAEVTAVGISHSF